MSSGIEPTPTDGEIESFMNRDKMSLREYAIWIGLIIIFIVLSRYLGW